MNELEDFSDVPEVEGWKPESRGHLQLAAGLMLFAVIAFGVLMAVITV